MIKDTQVAQFIATAKLHLSLLRSSLMTLTYLNIRHLTCLRRSV